MSSSYPNIDAWDGWDSVDWSLANELWPTDEAFNIDNGQLNGSSHCQAGFPPGSVQGHCVSPVSQGNRLVDGIAQHGQAWDQQPVYSMSTSTGDIFTDAMRLHQCFVNLPPRVDPPDIHGLHPQDPRFDGDLYTAPFIKGEGVERAGWCGFCSSWHKLKNSAYWYHLHYSHGVSCVTGRQLMGPQQIQWNHQHSGWQGLCALCNTWLTLGKGDRSAKTAYYRHAYQCQKRGNPQFEKPGGVKKSKSPRRLLKGGR